ncbi:MULTISPECIES: hypothetical protein [unclassified Cupriavidus]|uniref:hypothetical protein n=1 Tax=Cupriavidus sp. H19C3 TaxID=3241603 RepID=UPI0011D52D8E|nr:MAG: hypothetical protein E6Q40_04880 [Cupriavidus sp.]
MPASPPHPTPATRVGLAGIGALLVLVACTSIEGDAMQRVFDSWKSAPIEEAKLQWGPPLSVQSVPGGTAYVWIDEVPAPHPPGSGPRDAGLERPATPGRCQRKLVAGPDGKVTGGEWSGTACCVQTWVGRCAALLNRTRGTG